MTIPGELRIPARAQEKSQAVELIHFDSAAKNEARGKQRWQRFRQGREAKKRMPSGRQEAGLGGILPSLFAPEALRQPVARATCWVQGSMGFGECCWPGLRCS